MNVINFVNVWIYIDLNLEYRVAWKFGSGKFNKFDQ